MRHTQDVLTRLLNRLEIVDDNECWNFIGSKTYNGYGNFKVDGVCRRAHRISYQLNIGDIPDGLFVLHTCDNPACCNPKHLFLGTALQNTEDMERKNRQKYWGHNN